MSSKSQRKERRRLANLRASQAGIPHALRQPAVLHQQLQERFFSGPLPPPDQLEHYERVQPGFGERIMAMAELQYAMAESQTRHRQELEKSVVRNGVVLSYLGWGSAFFMGVAGLSVASYLMYLGRELGGGAAFVSSLAVLAGLFVYGKREQNKDLAAKRPPHE